MPGVLLAVRRVGELDRLAGGRSSNCCSRPQVHRSDATCRKPGKHAFRDSIWRAQDRMGTWRYEGMRAQMRGSGLVCWEARRCWRQSRGPASTSRYLSTRRGPVGHARVSRRPCPGLSTTTAPVQPDDRRLAAMRELDSRPRGVRWVCPDAVMAHPFEDGTASRCTVTSGRRFPLLTLRIPAPVPRGESSSSSTVRSPSRSSRRSSAACLRCGRRLRWPSALRRDGLLLARRMTDRSRLLASTCSAAPAVRRRGWPGSAQHSGLPPSTAGSGAFGFLLQLLGHRMAGRSPPAGRGRLPTRC